MLDHDELDENLYEPALAIAEAYNAQDCAQGDAYALLLFWLARHLVASGVAAEEVISAVASHARAQEAYIQRKEMH